MPDVTVDILAQMQGADKVTKDLDKLNKEGEELHKTFSAFVLETGIERLQDGIEESTKEVRRLGDAIEEVSASQLAKDAERVSIALADANSEAGKLGRSVLNAQSPLNDIRPDIPADKTKTGSGFRASSGSQVLSGLSQITGASQLQGGADFVGLIDDGSEALAGLGAATIPAAVGVGAIAAGLVVFNAALKAGEKAVQEVVVANKEYGERLKLVAEASQLSVDALQDRVAQARIDLETQIQTQDALTESLDRQREGFTYLQNVVANTGDIFNLGGAYESAADAADAAEEQTRKLSETLAILEAAAADAAVIDAAGKAVETQNELNRLREEASEEEIRSLLEENHAQSEVHQARRAAASQQLEEVNALIGAIRAAGLNIPEELLARQKLLETQYDNEQGAIDELATAHSQYNAILPDVIANTDALAASEARLAEVTERLDQARESQEQRLQATQKAFQSSSSDRDRAEQQLLATESQLAALESDRAKMMERRAQEEALAASQDARESALQAQIDAANAAAEVSKIQTDAASKQVDITSKLRDDINAINADFMRSELRAIQAFNLEQKRLREDTESELKQAALDNDVNAFLAARDSAVKQLSRGSEDFAIERRQAEEDRQLRINELREGAKQELELLKVETQNQLTLLQQGGEARLAQVQALEQQLVQLRERFAQENRALQDRFNQEDYNARVQALNETLKLNQRNYEQLVNQTANLALAVGRAAAQGFFAGAQGTVDASIQVAINQAFVEAG